MPWLGCLLAALASGAVPARARPPEHAAPRATPKTGAKAARKPGAAAEKAPARPHTITLAREPRGGEAHERKIAELREQLEGVLRDRPLSRARVGIEVMQISDGDVLFSHNADQRFNPASNTKILTTAAAIARLGGDYRYLTALYGPPPDVEGVITGDVYLRGSSDPSLSTTDLAELAHALADRGVVQIHGNLVVDRRPIGFDGLGGDGLILNRNTISVRVRPTEPKHAPIVTLESAVAGITLENHATTVKGKRSRLKLSVFKRDDHLVVEVGGRIAESRGTAVIGQRVADGALLCGHTLAGLLPDFGVALAGDVRAGERPAVSIAASDDPALATHHSAPLADVSRISNKPSNNFVADTIYKTLGGELFGLPGTLEKGTRAVGEWLVEHGIDKDRFHLVNGSGLTHENRITPGDLARLLRAIYFEPALAPDFLPSLAVAGIDGTIRNRFQGTPAIGLVRAKTGTLSGVSALSGYVGDKGDVIVFSILCEGFRGKLTPAVRHAQVRLVDAMLRYLRSDAQGDEPLRPGPVPETGDDMMSPPPDDDDKDSEADGDP